MPHAWLHNDSDWQSRTDDPCLKLRTYKVARDGPQDGFHASAVLFDLHSVVAFRRIALFYGSA